MLRALERAGLIIRSFESLERGALGGGQDGRRVVVVLHLRASHSHNVLFGHCMGYVVYYEVVVAV